MINVIYNKIKFNYYKNKNKQNHKINQINTQTKLKIALCGLLSNMSKQILKGCLDYVNQETQYKL